MRHFIMKYLFLICCVIIPVFSEEMDSRITKIEESILAVQKLYYVPGLAVGIVKDGKVVFAKGFGFRNIEKKLPVTKDTQFACGSLVKAQTSFIIGTLVDEGKVSWDTPVNTIIPHFQLNDPKNTFSVTVRDILSHRTGIANHILNWYSKEYFSDVDLYDFLRNVMASTGLRESYMYQNHMYMVAGKIIETLCNENYEDVIQDRIFNPLNMNKTGVSLSVVDRSNFASPYVFKRSAGLVETEIFNPTPVLAPSGGLISSVEDMNKWMIALLQEDNTFIQQSTLKEIQRLHTPFARAYTGTFKELGYGLGWRIAFRNGRYMLHHGGLLDGYTSRLALIPSEKLGVVIMSNNNGGATKALAGAIVDIMLNDTPEELMGDAIPDLSGGMANQEQAEPTHAFSAFVGQYYNDVYGYLEVTEGKNSLKVKVNNMEFNKLQHVNRNLFIATPKVPRGDFIPCRIFFQIDENDKINSVRLIEPSVFRVDNVFTRTTVDKNSSLDIFAGTYKMRDKFSVTVQKNDDRLIMILSHQPGTIFELTRIGYDTFAIRINGHKVEGISVLFTFDEKGIADSVTLTNQNVIAKYYK